MLSWEESEQVERKMGISMWRDETKDELRQLSRLRTRLLVCGAKDVKRLAPGIMAYLTAKGRFDTMVHLLATLGDEDASFEPSWVWNRWIKPSVSTIHCQLAVLSHCTGLETEGLRRRFDELVARELPIGDASLGNIVMQIDTAFVTLRGELEVLCGKALERTLVPGGGVS